MDFLSLCSSLWVAVMIKFMVVGTMVGYSYGMRLECHVVLASASFYFYLLDKKYNMIV